MTGDDTKHLPLEDLHNAAGARFGAFAGWSMPLTYPAGVMKEHLHTREHAGLFDISHMKLFVVSGPGAAGLLDRACPLDAGALDISQSKYTFFLNEAPTVDLNTVEIVLPTPGATEAPSFETPPPPSFGAPAPAFETPPPPKF